MKTPVKIDPFASYRDFVKHFFPGKGMANGQLAAEKVKLFDGGMLADNHLSQLRRSISGSVLRPKKAPHRDACKR